MKALIFLTLSILLTTYVQAKTGCENEANIAECSDTEYHTYISCIRKRMKRSLDCENSVEECTDCDDSCEQCDCDYCTVNECESRCNRCCPSNPPCTTSRCCHRSCHARCKSSVCRTDCRRSCHHKITGTNTTSSTNVTTIEKSQHNITTVINLHNVVNSTNVIDVPVQVNNTHVNNITLSESENPSIEIITNSTSQPIQENCCYVVSPRQCVPKEEYPYVKCFHYRRKVCGPICRAPIIHEQPHEVCDQTVSGTNCHQQIIYVPQPQPRCNYQSTWPYVSCGAQQPQQSCAGCYVHYASPFPQPPTNCPYSCYDDGYGNGPYYRQGPFYRPGYAHTPSCYQVGTCDVYGYPYNSYPNTQYPGFNYPPYTYENSVHIETNPNNVIQRAREDNSTKNKKEQVEEPIPAQYIPLPVPPYSALGYPYIPPYSPYFLPPEVDIQATINHPDKEGRYASITITDKRETKKKVIDEELGNEITTDKIQEDPEE